MKLRYALLPLLAVTAFATATKAAGPLNIFDMAYVFQCTKLAEGKVDRLFPKYASYPGIYAAIEGVNQKVCEFIGADGEHWHPLFPSHPAEKDESCRIAYEQQQKGNSISRFPTPPSCLEYNEVANLMSANAPASTNPELGQSNSFAARIEMIRRAKKSIRIQYLIFFGDESGWAIAEELKKKKAENPNIDIRVNVDALSNLANETNQEFRTQAMFFDLQQHGIPVMGAGITWIYMNEYHFLNPLALDKRWHDKIFVVDAEDPDNGYGIAGGQNIGNEYFRVGTYENGTPVFDHKIWRDQDVLLHGPIIRDLAKAFDNNFDHFKKVAANTLKELDPATKEKLRDRMLLRAEKEANILNMRVLSRVKETSKVEWDDLLEFLPKADPANRPYAMNPFQGKDWSLVSQVEKDCPKFFKGVSCQAVWDKVPGSHDRLRIQFYPYDNRYAGDGGNNKENGQPFMNQNIKKHIERIFAELDKGSLIQKLHDQNRFHRAEMRWFNNHPRFNETYIMQAYTDEVRRAKHEIIISNAYFIPHGDKEVGLDVDFMNEMKKAVTERGVHVILMSNDTADNDAPNITWNARWYYNDVFAWNTQAKVGPNGKKGLVDIYEWSGYKFHENTNHAKYGIFDGKEVIVGSFNLDHRSTAINSETVVALRSTPFAQEMVEQFKRNDLPKAIQITPAQAQAWHEEIKTSTDPKIRESNRPLIEKEN